MSIVEVVEYKHYHRAQVEDFRLLSFEEGNDSLAHDKYDPDNINGASWLVYVDGELAALSVVEASHYTGDEDIAARVCRLHIAKKFRPSWLGMVVGGYQIWWAKKNGYKILYFTHDIHNRAINAMYQHKRYGAPITDLQKELHYLWHTEWYQNLQTDKRMLFRVDENSDFLQYVYYWKLDEEFEWNPKKNMIWIDHNGDIQKTMTNQEILDAANVN